MDVLKLIATAESMPPAEPLTSSTIPDALASYQDETDPEVKAFWEITTVESADWALKRKGECEAEIAEIDAMRRARISEINRRAAELTARAEVGVSFFEFRLLQWMERNRSAIVHGKKKSRALLHGIVGWRASGERLAVTDPGALEAWLRSQPVGSPLVRWKVEPEMKALQAHFKATGEIPTGCEAKPEEDTPFTKAAAPMTALARE